MNRGAKKGTSRGHSNSSSCKKVQHKTEIWKWFSKLSLEERGNVLLWEDREGTCLLKQMYKKKSTEGEGFFLSGWKHFSISIPFHLHLLHPPPLLPSPLFPLPHLQSIQSMIPPYASSTRLHATTTPCCLQARTFASPSSPTSTTTSGT
jgi:hypothetical protein